MSPSGVEINRNIPFGHSRSARPRRRSVGSMKRGPRAKLGFCSIRPFTIRRLRAGTSSDSAIYLARRENLIEGMRKAGLPEE